MLPSQPQFDVRLAELKQLLAESDTTAIDALKALKAMAPDTARTAMLSKVAQHVELFDFDRALELLQGMASE